MKRYLALSGGGDKGLLLMGMMYQLSVHDIENVQYDEMSGISTGGLVAAITSSIERTNFPSEILKKKEIFMDPKFQVVEQWTWTSVLNIIDAYFFHNSIYNNEPLKKLLEVHYDPKQNKIPFTVGAYNKTKSRYETLQPTHDAVIATSALPIVLPSIKIGDSVYEDGGMKHLIPVNEIKEWLKLPGEKTIDVMCCFPINNVEKFKDMIVPKDSMGFTKTLRHSLADIMYTVMQNDLKDIADAMNANLDDIITSNVIQLKNKNNTIRLFSPQNGWYSNFTHMTPLNSERLFREGINTVHNYLNVSTKKL